MTTSVRRYAAAVSAEALALAWARQEDGPAGATVVVDNEVSPRGRNGRVWSVPAETTLAVAVVLRPEIGVDEADVLWLRAGLVAAAATERVGGPPVGTWWPDSVVDRRSGAELVMVKSEVQLGPGRIQSAVITLRFDLPGIGVDPADRSPLLRAVDEVVQAGQGLEDAEDMAARYTDQCVLTGRDVRLTLLPAGEARGRARAIDRAGRLELGSRTGMVERVPIDALRHLRVI